MFNANDYAFLHTLVFDKNYPGYKPNIIESPDGNESWDCKKRYAHINVDYIKDVYFANKCLYEKHLNIAYKKAKEIAIEIGIPSEFWPSYEHGTLRILEYPPGAVTHTHKDFNLFTLSCYRNLKENFITLGEDTNPRQYGFLKQAHQISEGIHFGELLELINPNNYKATKHEVIADEFDRSQYSIVYFAVPDYNVKLPNGQTVGEWTEQRKTRSRKEVY